MIEVLGVRLHNQREAADLLGVTIRTIRAMCRRGQLARTRVGADTYISEESLKNYLNGKLSKTDTDHADEQR